MLLAPSSTLKDNLAQWHNSIMHYGMNNYNSNIRMYCYMQFTQKDINCLLFPEMESKGSHTNYNIKNLSLTSLLESRGTKYHPNVQELYDNVDKWRKERREKMKMRNGILTVSGLLASFGLGFMACTQRLRQSHKACKHIRKAESDSWLILLLGVGCGIGATIKYVYKNTHEEMNLFTRICVNFSSLMNSIKQDEQNLQKNECTNNCYPEL